MGAEPFIPLKAGTGAGKSKGYKRDPDWEDLVRRFTMHPTDFYNEYHQRSNVETVFAMIKARFGGELLLSKSAVAQVNEVLMRVVCHNICVVINQMYRRGVEPEFGRGIMGQKWASDLKSRHLAQYP